MDALNMGMWTCQAGLSAKSVEENACRPRGSGIDDQMLNVSGLLRSEIAEFRPGDLIHRPAGGKEDTRSRDGTPTLR